MRKKANTSIRKVKPLTFFAASLLLLALAGCSESTANNGRQEEAPTYQTIHVTDGYDGIYDEGLNIELSASDVSDILKAVSDAESSGQAAGGIPWYAIEFLNAAGQQVAHLTVYPDRTIFTDDNNLYRRGGELDEALTALENRCDIDYSLVDRKPGDKYFALASHADNGNLYEFTENNFIEGLDIELTQEQLAGLVDILENYAGEFEEGEGETLYRLSLYTEQGSELYVLDFTESGDIYVGRWKMESRELRDWLKEISLEGMRGNGV